jgi:hypothetical protein
MFASDNMETEAILYLHGCSLPLNVQFDTAAGPSNFILYPYSAHIETIFCFCYSASGLQLNLVYADKMDNSKHMELVCYLHLASYSTV